MTFALLLSGCINTIRFPPDLWTWETADTGQGRDSGATTQTHTTPPEPAATEIENLDGGCDPAGEAWTWSFVANAWTLGGTLDLFRLSDDQQEQHALVLVSADPGGDWDQLQVGPLPDATPLPEQQSGINSRFDCDADEATLSIVVRLRDLSDTLSDCVVWGADPNGAVARIRAIDPEVTTLGGCRLWAP